MTRAMTAAISGMTTTQQARQRDIGAERQDDAANDQDRRRDHDRERQEHDHLHLLDVVRVARDQRRRPKVVDLGLRERLDLAEDGAANVTPETHRDSRAAVHADAIAAIAGDGGHDEHQRADPQDVVVVAARDAVVDDVGVEVGQVQVADRLHQQQEKHDDDQSGVGAQIGAQQPDHDLRRPRFPSRLRRAPGAWPAVRSGTPRAPRPRAGPAASSSCRAGAAGGVRRPRRPASLDERRRLADPLCRGAA